MKKRWMASVLGVLAVACGREEGPAVNPAEVRAVRVAAVPEDDPAARAWDAAPVHVEKLLVQDQTDPKNLERSVEDVRVRALHDGRRIALLIEWRDPTRDAVIGPGVFSDAVAVQFPVAAGGDVPDAAMGLQGKAVRIHQWKAAWQEAVEKGQDPLAVLYPNAHTDHYPYEAARDEAVRAEMETRYAPARAVGNPVAGVRRESPTQDLWAEGFGTLTADPRPVSRGKGVHDGRAWRVVLSRPLDGDAGGALRPGTRTYAAFAVWEGSHDNVGSRKMRTGWVPLQVEE